MNIDQAPAPGVRGPALGLGLSLLGGVIALGTLLGSTADSPATYVEHYAQDSALVVDLVGGLALIIAGVMAAWLVVVVRGDVRDPAVATTCDLAAALGVAASALLMGAAGLLMTVPFTGLLANVTGDEGITGAVQAGIAQAGSVMFFVAVIPLAIAVLLLISVSARTNQLPRWVRTTGRVTAILAAVLGSSVALLLPFGAWFVAYGLHWTTSPPPE